MSEYSDPKLETLPYISLHLINHIGLELDPVWGMF